jgi:hypothetical protein
MYIYIYLKRIKEKLSCSGASGRRREETAFIILFLREKLNCSWASGKRR